MRVRHWRRSVLAITPLSRQSAVSNRAIYSASGAPEPPDQISPGREIPWSPGRPLTPAYELPARLQAIDSARSSPCIPLLPTSSSLLPASNTLAGGHPLRTGRRIWVGGSSGMSKYPRRWAPSSDQEGLTSLPLEEKSKYPRRWAPSSDFADFEAFDAPVSV
jgi:hypothetical protein